MKKLFKAAVMGCTALSAVVGSPALAVATHVPTAAALSTENAATMLKTCTDAAAAYDTHNGDIWTGTVVLGTVSTTPASGPTEVLPLARTIDKDSIHGTGTLVPSAPYIKGNPYRNGGSVNLFGDQRASAAYYPSSTYNYTAYFNSSFDHPYSCHITQQVYHAGLYHPAVDIDHPAIGYYVINGVFGNSDDAIRQECVAYSAKQPADPLTGAMDPPWYGEDHGGNDNNDHVFHCVFVGTQAYHEHHDAYSDPATYTAGSIFDPTETPINQPQGPDLLNGHEANGGRVDVTGDLFIAQVVVCISPSTTSKNTQPSGWRAQNGYDGGDFAGAIDPVTLKPAVGCNTPYFKVASYGGGSQTSNGTYISVPNY